MVNIVVAAEAGLNVAPVISIVEPSGLSMSNSSSDQVPPTGLTASLNVKII